MNDCDLNVTKYERTPNQLIAKNNKNVGKKSSNSFANIWSKLKNGKTKKDIPDAIILLNTKHNNVVTIMSARSIPNTSRNMYGLNGIKKSMNSKSKTIHNNRVDNPLADKNHEKPNDNQIAIKDCKLPNTADNSFQSDSRLVQQVPYIAPKKLVKRSKIPRRRLKNYHKPHAARSVQNLRKPVGEQLLAVESAITNEVNDDKISYEKIEVGLTSDRIGILTDIRSMESYQSEPSSKHSRIRPPSHNCESELLKERQFGGSPNSDKSSDWGELDTSDNDLSLPMRRKVFGKDTSYPVSPTSQLSVDSFEKSSGKSLYSEKYNFFDAIFDVICWPLLFLKTNK